MKRATLVLAALTLLLGGLSPVQAGFTVIGAATVDGTDALFNYAGTATTDGSGTTPVLISLTPGTDRVLTFPLTGSGAPGVTGSVILNSGSGDNSNNPDGFGAAVGSSSNTGAAGISGITAPNAGFLTGVFLNGSESSVGHVTPASLNFSTIGTNFTSLSPLDDQTFFIGDGLTGNGTGSVQQFDIPNDATTLVLGIVDAYGYNGAPAAYGDNDGFFSVGYSITGDASAVPEPSTLALLGIGAVALGGYGWRRRKMALAA